MPRARSEATVQLVRDELERAPVRGLEIQLLPDTLGTSPVVTRARWASPVADVVAVVGSGLIRGSTVSAPIYNEARIPQVVPRATSSTRGAAGPWTFTQVPSNAAQADLIIDFMSTELEARTLTILKNALTRALEGTRAHLLDIVPVIDPLDANALVEPALLRGEPDVVFLVAGIASTDGLSREWANSGAGGVLIATDRLLESAGDVPIERIELVADRVIESSEQERAMLRQLSERMSS